MNFRYFSPLTDYNDIEKLWKKSHKKLQKLTGNLGKGAEGIKSGFYKQGSLLLTGLVETEWVVLHIHIFLSIIFSWRSRKFWSKKVKDNLRGSVIRNFLDIQIFNFRVFNITLYIQINYTEFCSKKCSLHKETSFLYLDASIMKNK